MSDHCLELEHHPATSQIEALPSDATFIIDNEELEPAQFTSSHRRRRQRRRWFRSSCKSIQLAMFLIAAAATTIIGRSCYAFSPPSLPTIRTSHTSNTRYSNYMSPVAEIPASKSKTTPQPSQQYGGGSTDFRRRMKNLVKRKQQQAVDRPNNVRTAFTLEEYKEVLDENNGKIVVVRFFATWCKACKAIQPAFYRMATLYPQIIFLEVPVTNQNTNLHQGLEVPSLPYGHIYYPKSGLVEELKISKKYFHNLVKLVRWYDKGECSIEEAPIKDESGNV